jgi:hypothetical protein
MRTLNQVDYVEVYWFDEVSTSIGMDMAARRRSKSDWTFNPAVIAIMPPWYMHRKERLVQNANAH